MHREYAARVRRTGRGGGAPGRPGAASPRSRGVLSGHCSGCRHLRGARVDGRGPRGPAPRARRRDHDRAGPEPAVWCAVVSDARPLRDRYRPCWRRFCRGRRGGLRRAAAGRGRRVGRPVAGCLPGGRVRAIAGPRAPRSRAASPRSPDCGSFARWSRGSRVRTPRAIVPASSAHRVARRVGRPLLAPLGARQRRVPGLPTHRDQSGAGTASAARYPGRGTARGGRPGARAIVRGSFVRLAIVGGQRRRVDAAGQVARHRSQSLRRVARRSRPSPAPVGAGRRAPARAAPPPTRRGWRPPARQQVAVVARPVARRGGHAVGGCPGGRPHVRDTARVVGGAGRGHPDRGTRPTTRGVPARKVPGHHAGRLWIDIEGRGREGQRAVRCVAGRLVVRPATAATAGRRRLQRAGPTPRDAGCCSRHACGRRGRKSAPRRQGTAHARGKRRKSADPG